MKFRYTIPTLPIDIKEEIKDLAEKEPLAILFLYSRYILQDYKFSKRIYKYWRNEDLDEVYFNEAKKLHDYGISVKEMSKILLIDENTLHKILHRRKYATRRRWAKREKEIIKENLLQGKTYVEIQKILADNGFYRGYDSIRFKGRQIKKEVGMK